MKKSSVTFLLAIVSSTMAFAQALTTPTGTIGTNSDNMVKVEGYTKLINPAGRTLIIERENEDSWLTFHDPNDYWYSMGIDRSNGGALTLNSGGTVGDNPHFVLTKYGNVGIGTTPTGSFKFAVEGKIGAREVNVTTASPWPDYVFEAGYKLPPLETIERYIQQNKHLPGVPTAAEVKEKGVDLGEMNALLLKKIEELTLYVIDLRKENTEIKRVISELNPGK